jgi:predicted glycogen debranching enzyme
MGAPVDDRTEWLETDGRGGFASGTASGVRTRRYHALLLAAVTPPTGRMVLVNGFDAWIETAGGTMALSSQRYLPDVLHPDGATRIASFVAEPWPTWEFVLPGGTRVRQELFVERASGACWLAWTLLTAGAAADDDVTLRVRPFLSGRDYHALHHENPACRFEGAASGAALTVAPYDGIPPVVLASDGGFAADPQWYRNFLYSAERERGLDDVEDLASPGTFSWRLTTARPRAVLTARTWPTSDFADGAAVVAAFEAAQAAERHRRMAFARPVDRAADAYLVQRGAGRTIVAGYPWFTDWGRDTFIAVRGLCLATGRFDEARDILVQWAGTVSEGMLPNRFADSGEQPEFNSVDASLWYVVAVGELLRAADATASTESGGHPFGFRLSAADRRVLTAAVEAIVAGYASGTRFGIRMEPDGLLAAGERGQQLTWMDARVGGREITPRIGKPVEVQALWYNAVAIAATLDARWAAVLPQIRRAFAARFWIEESGSLADVVDVDHVSGERDDTLRPNQILAVGGLPLALVAGRRARRIVEAVESALLTPLGLRSLTPHDPRYVGRYTGGPDSRDAAYHQGTVWPWLKGPFVEAWVRARGSTDRAKHQARQRFLEPFIAGFGAAEPSHIPEIADGDAPFTSRGCPFQAWSLGEYLRLDRRVLHVAPTREPRADETAAAHSIVVTGETIRSA